MYKYEDRTADDWQKNKERATSGDFDTFLKEEFKTKLWKPHEGHNEIRILPPAPDWASYKHYGLVIYRHLGIGPRNGAFLCHNHAVFDSLMPGRQHNECPICAVNEIARRDGNRELSKQLYAKPGCLVWLIDRAAMEKGPQLWIMPATKVDKEICLRAYDAKRNKAKAVDHPYNGYDISFEMEIQKTADNNFPNYSGLQLDSEPTPIVSDPAKVEKYLAFIMQFSLPTVLKYHDVAYIAKELGVSEPAKMVPMGNEDVKGKSEADIPWDDTFTPTPAPVPAQVAPSSAAPAPAPAPVEAPTAKATNVGKDASDALIGLNDWT